MKRSNVVCAVLLIIGALTCQVVAQTDTTITYQGTLDDQGEPANGAFDLEFSLFDALGGGNQVGSTIIMNDVEVTAGLFALELDFGASPFDNESRWLEIVVEGVTLSPRQPINRAPYSIQTRGIFVDDDGDVGIGTSTPLYPLHVESTETPIFGHANATDGSTYGGWFESSSTDGRGVLGWANSTTGNTFGVYGLSASSSGRGVYGRAEASTGSTYGGYFWSLSTSGRGVYGVAEASTGITDGVFGRSNSTSGRGICGWAPSSTGTTYGVYGTSDSTSGAGVSGEARAATGVTYGVFGTSDSTSGRGVYGEATASTGANYGVFGTNDSTDGGAGVRGEATASTGFTHGVYGRSESTLGTGVRGVVTTTTSGGPARGVYGTCETGLGVQGSANANTGTGIGVRGDTNAPNGYGVYSSGDFGGDGAKYFIQPHPYDPSKEIRFVCLEGNESGTYFRGSTSLVDGRAYIDVPEEFRLVSDTDGLTVQVTAMGPNAGLWVESKDLDQIVVVGNGNVEFDYFVNGVRRGFADLELIRENHAYVPDVRGVPYGTQYREAHRQILVENGILNPDFTPNEATAAMMGWTLRDPTPDELSRAASSAKEESR